MKRKFWLLIAVAMCLTMIMPFDTYAITHEGEFGNLYWSFDDATGTMVVSGQGAMDDVENGLNHPWESVSAQVKYLVVEEGITTIGEFAFGDMDIQTVSLPSTLTSIGAYAFQNTALTSVDIPDGVTDIGHNAFYLCEELQSVDFPENLEKLDYDAFSHTALQEVTFPKNVKEVSARVFAYCTELGQVTFTGDAPILSEYTFQFADVIAVYPVDNPTWKETIAKVYKGSVTWQPSGDFSTSGTFGNVDPFAWRLENGTLYIEGNGYMRWDHEGKAPWYNYRGYITRVVFSGTMDIIYTGALEDCVNLSEIVLPDALGAIFSKAFKNCKKLESIVIPHSVYSVMENAFSGCSALKSVYLRCRPGDIDLYKDCFPSVATVYYPGYYTEWESIAAIAKMTPTAYFCAGEHEDLIDNSKPATCTEGGASNTFCVACGQVLAGPAYIPPTDHTFGEWQIMDSTLEEGVWVERSCVDCGHTEQKLLEPQAPLPTDSVDTPTEPTQTPTDLPSEPTQPSGETTEPMQEGTQPVQPSVTTTDPTQPEITVTEEPKTFPWVIVVIAVAAIGVAAGGFLLARKRK